MSMGEMLHFSIKYKDLPNAFDKKDIKILIKIAENLRQGNH